jgi:hypothetical protein
VLALAPGILALFGSHWDKSKYKVSLVADPSDFHALSRTLYGLLLTGGALLVSAVIQANTFGLSLYHALIILNLSWLTNITTVTSLLINTMIKTDPKPYNKREVWTSTEFLAYVVHFCATGAFGLWVFSDVKDFGIGQECASSTVYWILGYGETPATNPIFRIFWLVVYAFAAVPVANALLFLSLNTAILSVFYFFMTVFSGICMLCFCPSFLTKTPTESDERLIWRGWKAILGSPYVITPLFLDILLILTTEKTIASNRVGPEETYWTFGQTLALIVALPYLIGVCKQIVIVLRRRSQRKEHAATPDEEDPSTLDQEDGPKIKLTAVNP